MYILTDQQVKTTHKHLDHIVSDTVDSGVFSPCHHVKVIDSVLANAVEVHDIIPLAEAIEDVKTRQIRHSFHSPIDPSGQ